MEIEYSYDILRNARNTFKINGTKCALNIDKLELTFLRTKEFQNLIEQEYESFTYRNDKNNSTLLDCQDFRLDVPSNRMHKHYRYELDVMFKSPNEKNELCDKRLGTFYFDSYNPTRQQVYFLFENESLYDKELAYIEFVSEKLGLDFQCISKMELALDVNKDIITRFYRIHKNKQYTPIILNKKILDMNKVLKNILHISIGSRNNPFKIKSFYIKNKENGLELNCYDKSDEIGSNDGIKSYIEEKVGFKPIYRLEIRVSHKLLNDTLKKMHLNDEDSFYKTIGNVQSLFDLYLRLLDRIIRINYKNYTYNFLDIIL